MSAQQKRTAGRRPPKKKTPLAFFGVGGYMRRSFFAGLIVLMPFIFTFVIVRWVVFFIDSRIAPLIPQRLSTWAIEHIGIDPVRDIPGAGIVIFFVATMIVGIFARGLIGAWILRRIERVLHLTPLLPKIYSTTKQIFSTLFRPDKKTAFRKAVLVQYPRKGCWTIGFLTAETVPEISKKNGGRPMRVVFVPTTPNPTSGFIIFFPKEETVDLNMRVEDAVKMVFSFGIVQPPTFVRGKARAKRKGEERRAK